MQLKHSFTYFQYLFINFYFCLENVRRMLIHLSFTYIWVLILIILIMNNKLRKKISMHLVYLQQKSVLYEKNALLKSLRLIHPITVNLHAAIRHIKYPRRNIMNNTIYIIYPVKYINRWRYNVVATYISNY